MPKTYVVKQIPTDDLYTKNTNIDVGDLGIFVAEEGDCVLLYNKKWNGHSGIKFDLRDKHYWWFKKDDVCCIATLE